MPVLGELVIKYEPLDVWNEQEGRYKRVDNIYCFDINELIKEFPHLNECKTMEGYLLEIKNERNTLIKVFKPPKKLQLSVGRVYSTNKRGYQYYLVISNETAIKFGLGKDYRLIVLLMKHDNKTLSPFEIRQIGYYNVEKPLHYVNSIKEMLDLLSIDQLELQTAVKYTFDSHLRLQEGDIEGARASLRKSLEALMSFLKIVEVVKTEEAIEEESAKFPSKMRALISRMQDLLHYGGAHLGPAPKTTTEMLFHMTVDVLKGLAKLIDKNLIVIKEGENNE